MAILVFDTVWDTFWIKRSNGDDLGIIETVRNSNLLHQLISFTGGCVRPVDHIGTLFVGFGME